MNKLQPEMKALNQWLKKAGNTPAFIATSLGYKSTNTIYSWIARKRIPQRMCIPVMEIISKGDARQ